MGCWRSSESMARIYNNSEQFRGSGLSPPPITSSTEPAGRPVWRRGRLLRLLVTTFVPPDATVVIGLDDTIERRWGAKISARGIYRDPVRSSKGHFVKTSGLRWLSAQLLVRVPWAGRIMALPFLTLLAPSSRFYADKAREPKTLIDWARQAILQVHRWLPGRRIVVVADTAFAAIELLVAARHHVGIVTRLRLDVSAGENPRIDDGVICRRKRERSRCEGSRWGFRTAGRRDRCRFGRCSTDRRARGEVQGPGAGSGSGLLHFMCSGDVPDSGVSASKGRNPQSCGTLG
jgi:hypothetical protein